MRYGDRRDRELGTKLCREERRQDAADTKSGNRRDATGKYGRDCDKEVEHCGMQCRTRRGLALQTRAPGRSREANSRVLVPFPFLRYWGDDGRFAGRRLEQVRLDRTDGIHAAEVHVRLFAV